MVAKAIIDATLIEQRGSLSRAAEALNLPRHTLSNRIAQMYIAGLMDPDRRHLERYNVKLADENKRLREELKSVHRESLSADKVRKEILGLAERTPAPPDWTVRQKVGGSPGIPTTVWSDWHYGEVVTSQGTNGVNEFNCEIAKRRCRLLVERLINLSYEHMVRPNYPGIVVALLGDIVSGEIHEELTWTNDRHNVAAVIEVVELLLWALREVAKAFGRVHVVCAPGNHGRLARRWHYKESVVRNLDWLVYCMLEKHLAADDRITFDIPENGEPMWRIYNMQYLGMHGHDLGVRGGDGIIGALGPIARGQVKVTNMQSQINRDFDHLVIGHWHQYISLPRITVNNSLKGYDEYARIALKATYSRPSQALWFTHPRHDITARWEILLDEKREGVQPTTIQWMCDTNDNEHAQS